MAKKFADRVLATEDNCSGRSNSENRARGEAIPGPGPCSVSTGRISWVAEDELREEDHLGK